MTNDFTLALEMSFRARYSNVQLTLPQIERRMDLYTEWLKYWLNQQYFDQNNIPLFYTENKEFKGFKWKEHSCVHLETFDQWLIFTGHQELAINQYDRPKVATGLFHEQLLNDLINYRPCT